MRLNLAIWTLVGFLLAVTACHKKPPVVVAPPAPPPDPAVVAIETANRAFNASDYTAAAPAYQEYLLLKPEGEWRDLALFNLGVIYASTSFPRHDWYQATAYFRQLIAERPESSWARAANTIVNLRDQIGEQTANATERDRRIQELNAELDNLKRAPARLAIE